MKKQLSRGSFRIVLFLLGVALVGAVFMRSGQTVSSQKRGMSAPDSRIAAELGRVTDPAASNFGMAPVKSSHLRPQSATAVWAGESRPVSELAAEEQAQAARYGWGKNSSRGIKGEPAENRTWDFWLGRPENEKNERNREIIRKIDPDAKGTEDGAIAYVPAPGKGRMGRVGAPDVMPGPLVSFETISLTDTVAIGQGFLPPDINGEVGPNHFVETVNVGYRVYNKTGTPLMALTSIGTLFSAVPGPCGQLANAEDGDPIVMYDQLADRWLISEFCVSVANPNNHQLIAISKTGDPTGAYWLYDFMMPNNKFNDYPHFGVWPDGYYMTDNQFNQAGTAFQGAGVFAFNRAKMIAGDPTANLIYFDTCPSNSGCDFGGMLTSDLDGFGLPPAGAPNQVMQFDDDQQGGAADQLRIFNFHADFTTPANSTYSERTGSPLAVASFDSREVPAGSRNVIPQPPAGIAVDAISDRLMFRLSYRNFGSYEALALNNTVNAATNPVFRAGVRYYELRKTTPGGAWTVNEQGTMAGAGGDTEHRWMGSTALNGSGSQAVAYSVSSASVFPSIRYAGRLTSDPAGSLAQGEATLVAGTSSQTHSSGRWGDYTDLTVDPTDDCTFWYAGEYITGASSPDNTRWHTRVGSFKFGPCAPVQKGILNGTVTSSAGGAPIPNAAIDAGGYTRSTNGSGVYSIDPIGTGTYTVTASATGYAAGSAAGVVVSTGGTTVQNFQLTPQNILTPGTPAITAESCAPANNALDPGETVTVNLPISNTGGAGATTSSLVATLQATGGVTSPSGPQNYGAVAQGSPAVVRAFSFTVSSTCGSVTSVTLQLQDGMTNYGTITYPMQTGNLGAASAMSVTTGNIATPIPDVSSVDIPLPNITQTGAVADVNVKVRLNHTFDGDVSIALVAPDNTVVPLSTRRSNPDDSGDNYGTGSNDCSGTPTIFDDAAANPISAGTPPFAGSFQPESPLAAMNGKSITGTWKLRVTDSAPLDTGTVGCVTLDFQRQPYLCCGVVGTPIISAAPPATLSYDSGFNGKADPGELVTVNLPLTNTGDGATTNLLATLQATGGVQGPQSMAPDISGTNPQSYGAMAPTATVSRPFTFRVNPQLACGGTITMTLNLQDGVINLGTAVFTMPTGTTTTASQTVTNVTPIIIPATGTGATSGAPASPYPSGVTVAGVTAPVSNVTVTLNQISHTFPGDVDVLLVGPTGVKFIVMSDVIGGTDWTGQTYTFDDTAAALMPSSGTPPASGSFKPTNYGTGDLFPAPAPAAPYGNPATAGTATFASSFNGLSPNGPWSLYVVDDAATDIGTIAGGWSLGITTSQVTCQAPTAAKVDVSGRVTTADGAGLRNAIVTMRDANGNVRTAVTGAFGYYTFSEVEVGSYVMGVASKRYTFTARPVNVSDTLTDVDFMANF